MKNRPATAQEDISLRVMRLLQEDPDLIQRELAEQLGVSIGRLNYCLKARVEKGWIKMQNFTHSKNKFGYVYVLTSHGIAEKTALTSRPLKRKMDKHETLRAKMKTLKVDVVQQNDDASPGGAGDD